MAAGPEDTSGCGEDPCEAGFKNRLLLASRTSLREALFIILNIVMSHCRGQDIALPRLDPDQILEATKTVEGFTKLLERKWTRFDRTEYQNSGEGQAA